MTKESESVVDSGGGGGGGVAPQPPPEMKGWLFKWTNYIKGYQKRWFVLHNGLLSYYRNAAEMARSCRGTISLPGAWIRREDSLNFVVSNGGGTQTFHLRANSEMELQKWVTALEIAKAQDNPKAEDDSEEEVLPQEGEDDLEKRELLNSIKTMATKLETCHKLILKNYSPLQQALDDALQENDSDLRDRIKIIKERSSLFKLASDMVMEASSDFLELSLSQGVRWQRLLASEREQRLKLEDMVEHMAKDNSRLENQVRSEMNEQTDHLLHNKTNYAAQAVSNATNIPSAHPTNHNQNYSSSSTKDEHESSDEDDVFVDAVDEQEIDFTVPVPPGLQMSQSHRRTDSDLSNKLLGQSDEVDDAQDLDRVSNFSCDEDNPSNMQFNVIHRKNVSDLKTGDEGDEDAEKSSTAPVKAVSIRNRRSRIPNKPDISFSLWSIMKNCIGKDLTKIPVPVNFAEPLSMLQRLVEDFEYSELLDKALTAGNDREQMLYVAAFTVSAYSTTAIRVGKPFNPLLGETYECDRSDDKGFRSISEQVSHHPPMVAQYCESTNGSWRYWQEFTMRSKFKGKYLEVEPLGIAHLEFTESGNHYTWRKVKTLVHNFVVGKLWIDQMGEMEIVNHKNWDKCHMKFEPYSYFVGGAKKVTGTITSGTTGSVEWVLNGKWDSKFEGSRVLGETNTKGKSSLEIEAPILLWQVNPPSKESEKYYNFSTFACELNEIEDGVAPTDSRLRPDQRLMENGQWDEANTEKIRLEEKQRAVRKQREVEAESAIREGKEPEPYTPIWFKKENDQQNGDKLIHIYQGNYWECKDKQNWSMCPDIF